MNSEYMNNARGPKLARLGENHPAVSSGQHPVASIFAFTINRIWALYFISSGLENSLLHSLHGNFLAIDEVFKSNRDGTLIGIWCPLEQKIEVNETKEQR